LHRFQHLCLFLTALLIAVCCVPGFAFAESDNLILNPGFESVTSDLADDWSASAWYTDEEATQYAVSDMAHTGSSSVYLKNEWMNDARYQQTVSVHENSIYRFSAFVKASGISEGWGANLSVQDTFARSTGVLDTQGEWVEQVLYFETTDNQEEVTLFLRIGGYSAEASGEAWFDDVSLTQVTSQEVPEGFVIESVAQAMGQSTAAADAVDDTGVLFLLPSILIALAALILVYGCRSFLQVSDAMGEDQVAWKNSRTVLFASLAAAALFRLILAPLVYGYPNDMSCWMFWGDAMVENGPSGFYLTDMFCDYPPLYLYILWLFGGIQRLVGIELGSTLHMALMKIPPILADLCTCVLLYEIARRKGRSPVFCTGIAILYAFMPAIWFNSACFGQIDSILALLVLIYLYLLYEDRILPASIILVLGVLTKPQMLLVAPVLLVVFIHYWVRNGARASLILFVKSLAAGLGIGLLAILPFSIHQDPLWIVRLYLETLGSYPYGSISACNMMTLIGGLWTSDTTLFLGVTLKVWGYIGIALSVALYFVLSWKKRERESLFLHAALLLTGIFAFGCYMHERYLFPVLALLLTGYILTGKRNQLFWFLGLSSTLFINVALVLANKYLPSEHWISYLVSALVVVLYILMAVNAVLDAWGKKEISLIPAFRLRIAEDTEGSVTAFAARKVMQSDPPRSSLPEKKDIVPLCILTAVYAIVAFVYLGSTSTPQTYWETGKSGESVIVDLGENHAEVRDLWTYRGLSYDSAQVNVEVSSDQKNWSFVRELYMMDHGRSGDVWRWFTDDLVIPSDMRYVRFTVEMPVYRFHEIFFRDGEGNVVPVQQVLEGEVREHGPAAAFDEQQNYYESESFYNATYFDEIYHARTAWEMLEGKSIYETTHPPLGKTLIGLGIRLFGLTPFGWRFTGTLIGVLMIPVMFLLGKALFRDSRFAFAATFLLTFDFMHFVQTRISTIDSYSVFFTMLMMYFMLRFLQHNYHKAPLHKLLLHLGLSGLFFGLGAASKWTCLYSGAGLAVMFFFALGTRVREAVLASQHRLEGVELSEQDQVARRFIRRTGIILLWCVLVFVIIPSIIYCLSYLPYMKDGFDLKVVIDNQKSMFSYHSTLVDDHFFQSPWYQWPFMIKPMWFYKNYALPAGHMGSIATFGNPLVWWTGTVSILYLLLRCVKNGFRAEKSWWIMAGYLSQLLPWVLVPRSMFIYHYFGSVPFFILSTVMLYRELEKDFPITVKRVGVGFAIAVVVLFIAFYPVLSGMPISSSYGQLLKWLPTWYFTY